MRVLDVVVPLLLVAVAAAGLLSTVRSRVPIVFDWSRPYFWVLVVLWAMLVGDAAFGEHRPTFERAWKGSVALLVGVAFAINLWGRRRRSDRDPGRRSRPEPQPEPGLRGEPVDD